MKISFASIALSCVLAFPGIAISAPQSFFGHDAGNATGTQLTERPNADAQRNAFLAILDAYEVEDFESFERWDHDLDISFGTISGGLNLWIDNIVEEGRYAASGENYLLSSVSYFDLVFTSPVTGFGFYGMDIGDYSGSFYLEVFYASSTTPERLDLPPLPGSSGSSNGDVFFWGFADTEREISSIRFHNTNAHGNSAAADWFAFDDFIAGTAKTTEVPEPAPLSLLMLGLAGVLGLSQRRKGQKD